MSDTADILTMEAGRELRHAGREDSHHFPEFELPAGWERNEPMCEADRTAISLRNEEYGDLEVTVGD